MKIQSNRNLHINVKIIGCVFRYCVVCGLSNLSNTVNVD